jgi:hypothetical protein
MPAKSFSRVLIDRGTWRASAVQMRLLLAALLFTITAALRSFTQAVDLVQRIDQLYPWLNVIGIDRDAQGNVYLAGERKVQYRPRSIFGLDRWVAGICRDQAGSAGRQVYGAAIGGTQDEFVGGVESRFPGNLCLRHDQLRRLSGDLAPAFSQRGGSLETRRDRQCPLPKRLD